MLTAKGLLKEMQEAGFLTIEEIREILGIEYTHQEIEKIVEKLKKDKVYKDFLDGKYSKCSCCKNVYTYNCFYTVRGNQLRSTCKNCYLKAQKKYKDKRKDYNKKAYIKRKEKGIKTKTDINAVRKSKLKKALFIRFNRQYNKKILEELLKAKFSSCYNIKNYILFELCFNKNGDYIGIKKLEELHGKS